MALFWLIGKNRGYALKFCAELPTMLCSPKVSGVHARDDIMKITDSIKNVSSPSVGSSAGAKSSAKSNSAVATTGSSASASTVVNLQSGADSIASTSPTLQALQSTIAGTGTFNTQKVEAIKQAIAGGQFSVDASKVANELITSVRGLLAGGRSGGSQA